jgi:glycosyltransferase involved in cell wall biosynthesis
MGDGGSGLFAAPDPHDLAANVEWLLNHPDQWPVLGSGARQRAQQFLWDEVLDQLFARYAEVVEASRS